MRCEFCGRELDVRRLTEFGVMVPIPCDCDGAKRQREEEDRREWREERGRVLRRSVANAKIPPKFRLYGEYGDGTGLYIYGEQGRGKTERACGALRQWLSEGIIEVAHNRFFQTRSAKFVSVPEWLMDMRRTYDVRGESESDLMGSYAGVGMLCLDDLGKGQMTPWAVERIYTLLDLRYRDDVPTIITSQYSGEALVSRIAASSDMETASAIWSRIGGMCRVIRIGGPDWRRENFQNSRSD